MMRRSRFGRLLPLILNANSTELIFFRFLFEGIGAITNPKRLSLCIPIVYDRVGKVWLFYGRAVFITILIRIADSNFGNIFVAFVLGIVINSTDRNQDFAGEI